MPTPTQHRVGDHPIEIAVIPFPDMRERLLSFMEMLQALPMQHRDQATEDTILPLAPLQEGSVSSSEASAGSRVATFTFTSKPSGRQNLRPGLDLWLKEFFVHFVDSVRVWCLTADVFDLECFEVSLGAPKGKQQNHVQGLNTNVVRSTLDATRVHSQVSLAGKWRPIEKHESVEMRKGRTFHSDFMRRCCISWHSGNMSEGESRKTPIGKSITVHHACASVYPDMDVPCGPVSGTPSTKQKPDNPPRQSSQPTHYQIIPSF